MKPLNKLAESPLSSGSTLELWERDGAYFLLLDGLQTTSSFAHGGDDAMAAAAAAPIKRANQPAILIDGLGLGLLLQAVSNEINKTRAVFTVAEPCEALAEWNSSFLDALHPGLMQDPRINMEPCTVLQVARKSPQRYHAILMRSLHSRCPLSLGEASDLGSALKPGGMLAILLSRPDPKLERLLQRAGFETSTTSVPASHKGKQSSFHTLLLGVRGRFTPFAQR